MTNHTTIQSMSRGGADKTTYQYVVGFYFSPGLDRVALVRKCKPEWQAGKLNGVGGKVEAGESPIDAMVREFSEETGHHTHSSSWKYYARMRGDDWIVDLFVTSGNGIRKFKGTEQEPIEEISADAFSPLRNDMVENLPWLICLAIDHLCDGRPAFTEIKYP